MTRARLFLLQRQTSALDSLHTAALAQEKGRPGPLLQRPDHRAGEEVRDAEVPLAPGEEEAGQDAAAQRETGGGREGFTLLSFSSSIFI